MPSDYTVLSLKSSLWNNVYYSRCGLQQHFDRSTSSTLEKYKFGQVPNV